MGARLRCASYVVLAQPNDDRSAVFKVYINPLINLVWFAGLIVTLGTFIILLPDPKEKRKGVIEQKTKPEKQVLIETI